ncbi:MAG TPA: TOPRIM nucleotidyl transferase/hydrolase domain-containing protein [Streptosporangiaceae bacterium]
MLLKSIEAAGFLSFGGQVKLEVGPGLTVVTGPNGAGKSNLGRCLDLARAVIGRAADQPAAERLDLYEQAGYEGARSFAVELAIELDQLWEQDLTWSFVCACFASGSMANDSPSPQELDETVRTWLAEETLAPLWSGVLVVHHDASRPRPWFAAWQFTHAGDTWHVVLAGDYLYQLRPGPAVAQPQASGSGPLTDWLLSSKPQDDASLDFRVALQETGQPITFSAGSGSTSDAITESMRELGSALGADPRNRTFGFDQVMSAVLQRGIVLTDNRRLPLKRHFRVGELGSPPDLRDGASVAAELHRLKNGYPDQRERFSKIQATFKALTGRDLDVRARPAQQAQEDSGDPGMIIEPTVAGLHGERLVELSGAGFQEALVLSVLLPGGEPGQLAVLDEPAVNLEPTVQRRLIARMRGPGQYMIITHSADLVPVEDPGDLERVVRVAPGRSGSVIRRPQFGGLDTGELLRQLSLLEPTHVRGLLFARAVILCEGQTEVGALPRWWRQAPSIDLPDPASANIPVVSVDGDSSFGAYVRYLDAFGVPWAIVADGPALRPESKLAGHLRRRDCWPDERPDDQEDFTLWRQFWERLGVFTLADQFGNDGSKLGEFEAYLGRVDASLLAEVEAEVGKKHKPRVGAYFAAKHLDAPDEVMDLYRKIAARFELEGGR